MNTHSLFSRLCHPQFPARPPSCWSRWLGAVQPSAARFMTRPGMATWQMVKALLKDHLDLVFSRDRLQFDETGVFLMPSTQYLKTTK
jgi:hypothetical protein